MIKRIKKEDLKDLPYPAVARLDYVGQWIAWNSSQTEIVAHGRDVAGVHAAAIEAGHPDAILEKVRAPGIFIGAI
ncbi:MAG: hypothetical protein WD669_07700 [Pirellulales bacterium]